MHPGDGTWHVCPGHNPDVLDREDSSLYVKFIYHRCSIAHHHQRNWCLVLNMKFIRAVHRGLQNQFTQEIMKGFLLKVVQHHRCIDKLVLSIVQGKMI